MLSAPELSPPAVAPEVLADIAIGLGRSVTLGEAKLLGSGTRRYARLLVTPAYDAWLIEWDPDANLDLHDHGGSSGAFHVVDVGAPEPRSAL